MEKSQKSHDGQTIRNLVLYFSVSTNWMAIQAKSFSFEALLTEVDSMLVKTVIFLPPDVVGKLPKGRVRTEGTFNGTPFALAVQHLRDGARFFSVSGPLRKAMKSKIGDRIVVKFRIVDPDKLDVPEELEAVLAQDDEARKAWEKLTTGYQRSLIHYITSVKNVDSRIKRSIDLLNRAKFGQLHGQKRSREGDSEA